MKDRDIDKDTVVAYHEYIQGRIQGTLNGIRFGPGKTLCDIAIGLFVFAAVCAIVGILVITLRFRHVYLWDWNDQFVGPFFVVLFILCTGAAVLLMKLAHKRTNKYRRHLVVRNCIENIDLQTENTPTLKISILSVKISPGCQ